jgi:hydroxymethylpyrimidine pyrophosphatase-like HAD family hydrolase
MMPRLPLHIGLDLHGTLLDKRERLPPRYVRPLVRQLRALRPRARLYVCTGNDMGFVRNVLPPEVRRALHGYVLETGASAWQRGREVPLTSERTRREVARLRSALEEAQLPGVKHFAPRHTSVSVFTRRPYTRDPPQALVPAVRRIVRHEGLARRFDVKFSSVAVDVVPRGFHKHRGLRALAGRCSIAAIADSQNDWEFLARSDFAFVPRNASPEVLRILAEHGKAVQPLGRVAPGWHRGLVLRAAHAETRGALDALAFLDAALGQRP